MSDLAPRVNVPVIAARIAAKAVLGSVPGIGPLLVAVLDEVVPLLRAEKLQAFAEELNGRVLDLSPDTLSDRVREPNRFNLLEDGLRQAACASSLERVSQIANVVAKGLTKEDAKAEDRRYLLQLLMSADELPPMNSPSATLLKRKRGTPCLQSARVPNIPSSTIFRRSPNWNRARWISERRLIG